MYFTINSGKNGTQINFSENMGQKKIYFPNKLTKVLECRFLLFTI